MSDHATCICEDILLKKKQNPQARTTPPKAARRAPPAGQGCRCFLPANTPPKKRRKHESNTTNHVWTFVGSSTFIQQAHSHLRGSAHSGRDGREQATQRQASLRSITPYILPSASRVVGPLNKLLKRQQLSTPGFVGRSRKISIESAHAYGGTETNATNPTPGGVWAGGGMHTKYATAAAVRLTT